MLPKKKKAVHVLADRLEAIRKERKQSQKDFCAFLGVPDRSYRGWVNGYLDHDINGKAITKRNMPEIDTLISICEKLNVSLDYLFGRTNYTKVSNELIGKETGLSDDAINRLTEHKRNTKKRKQDDDISKLALTGINKLLEHPFGSSVLFWIGMYLDESEIKGYISKGKQIPFKELRKGKQIIHNDLYVYDESNKQLRIDYDIIRTAIFDKIRNSLFAVENE